MGAEFYSTWAIPVPLVRGRRRPGGLRVNGRSPVLASQRQRDCSRSLRTTSSGQGIPGTPKAGKTPVEKIRRCGDHVRSGFAGEDAGS